MFTVLKPTKDCYISNRVIKGKVNLTANTGQAGSCDLYKLYGYSSTLVSGTAVPNTELTRALVKFDLSPLKVLVSKGLVDVNNPTFSCKLFMYDVYGGQPTPSDFTLTVFPLSSSFTEGMGRDVVFGADGDVANFLSSSRNSPWMLPGCSLAGNDSVLCDYITGSGELDLKASQLFVTGEENLNVDITKIISASLSGQIPDEGLRISYDQVLENDNHTYFVKRFGTRSAFSEDKRPKIIVRYDDSIQDDTNNTCFDTNNTIFLKNFSRNVPSNLMSGSSEITGHDCIKVKLETEVSGGYQQFQFFGSQHYNGIHPVVGVYSSSINIPANNPVISSKLHQSGNVKFNVIWSSLDNSIGFHTSSVVIRPTTVGNTSNIANYSISVLGLKSTHFSSENPLLKVHIFDFTSPTISGARLPIELPGIVLRDVHFQVRNVDTNEAVIPFDLSTNSTRVSNDASSMYFKLDMSALVPERSYVIDVMTVNCLDTQLYGNVSPVFRVKYS
jgi:hypothetical protein